MWWVINIGIMVFGYFANRAIANIVANRRKPPLPGGFESPLVAAGSCIPVLYGTRRIRPIPVWFKGAKLVEININGHSLFGSFPSTKTLGYTYKVTAQLVVCFGEVRSIANMIFGANNKALSDQSLTQQIDFGNGTVVTVPTFGTVHGGVVDSAEDLAHPGPHGGSLEIYDGGVGEITLMLPNLFGGFTKGGGFTAGGGDSNDPYGGTIRFYIGGRMTEPDPTMVAELGAANVPSYKELCYIVLNDVNVGASPVPEPVDVICYSEPRDEMRIPGGSGGMAINARAMPGKYWRWHAIDISAAAVIYDLLRNPMYGLAEPDHMIEGAGVGDGRGTSGTFEDAQRALVGEGLGVSLVFSGDRGKAQDAIDELLRTVDAVLVRHPVTFKRRLKLIRNEAQTVDEFNALRSFDETDIEGLAPVTRNEWSETHNVITVEFSNAEKFYEKDTITVRNEANIAMTGGERSLTVQYMAVTDGGVALKLAARDLKRESLRLWKGQAKITRRAWDLEIGDVFKLNYAKYNFVNLLVRVMTVDLGEELDGTVTVGWCEDVFSYDDILRPEIPAPPILRFPTIVRPIITTVVPSAASGVGTLAFTLVDPEHRVVKIEGRNQVGGAPPSDWETVFTAAADTSDPTFAFNDHVTDGNANGVHTYTVPLSYAGASAISIRVTYIAYGIPADPLGDLGQLFVDFTFPAVIAPRILWRYEMPADTGIVRVTVDGLQGDVGLAVQEVETWFTKDDGTESAHVFFTVQVGRDDMGFIPPPWVLNGVGTLAPGDSGAVHCKVRYLSYQNETVGDVSMTVEEQLPASRGAGRTVTATWTIGDGVNVQAAGALCSLAFTISGTATKWKVQSVPASTARFDVWRNNGGHVMPTVADSLGLSFGPTAHEIEEGGFSPPIAVADGDNVTLVLLSNDLGKQFTVSITLEGVTD